MLKRQGTGRGEEDGKEGEKEKKIKMKHILVYAYICDWCLHNNTIDNHYRHSHCLLNLISTEKYGGMEKQKGRLRKRKRPRRKRPVLNTEMAADTAKGGVKNQANLFIYSHSASWIFNSCSVIHPDTEAVVSSSLTGDRNWVSLLPGENYVRTIDLTFFLLDVCCDSGSQLLNA